MPWKNGGGTTTELFRLPDPDGDGFLLRLSVADVEQDGPFSFFPGIDRVLLILKGNGCILNDKTRLTIDSTPLHFSGEEEIHCHLINGGFKDFNVMTKRGWKMAEVMRGKFSSCSAKNSSFVFLVESQVLYQLDAESISFTEQDAIIVSLT